MLCADATRIVRLKYALSASSCSTSANWRFVVERLMFTTSKPCSTAQRRPAEQDRAGARVAGAEHADAVDLALRREPADDAGARRAVAAEVALLVGRRDRVAVLVDGDRDGAADLADLRMVRLDAAVEDADAHALAGRALERPLARDALGPLRSRA